MEGTPAPGKEGGSGRPAVTTVGFREAALRDADGHMAFLAAESPGAAGLFSECWTDVSEAPTRPRSRRP